MKTLIKLSPYPHRVYPLFIDCQLDIPTTIFQCIAFFVKTPMLLKDRLLSQNPSFPKKIQGQPSNHLLPMIMHIEETHTYLEPLRNDYDYNTWGIYAHLSTTLTQGENKEHSTIIYILKCSSRIWRITTKYWSLKFLKLSTKPSNISFAWRNKRNHCPNSVLVWVCYILSKFKNNLSRCAIPVLVLILKCYTCLTREMQLR